MLSAATAAGMLPNLATSCRSYPVQPARAFPLGLQAFRTKATMDDTRLCLKQEMLSQHPDKKHSFERRPMYHLAPAGGWINDPNGPLFHKGTYHLFYQHVPNSSEWQWGLVWGHAKSKDLVSWEHLPIALEPTPHGLDQHGCFSGCATTNVDGRPALLYTGVIRKAPHEIEPGISPQHESQLIAVAADPDDPDLQHWHKLPGSFLPHPPADMDLTGWRDPCVLERPTAASPWWYVMVGAGVRNKCGTALVYRSQSLTEGWQYVGPLCESPSSFMWECPILAHLSSAVPSERSASTTEAPGSRLQQRHMLAVSPDYCVNMIQYYLGDYKDGRFDLQTAEGPFLMDLGDIMYAPNVLTDKHGRTILWAWLQEKQHQRPPGAYSSSCCLCVPRALFLSPDGKALLQEPLPELRELRQEQGAWHAGAAAAGSTCNSSTSVPLAPGTGLFLGSDASGFLSSSLDVELQVAKGEAESIVLVLHPFDGTPSPAGAAVAYCWTTNTLQVIHSTDLATLERVAALPVNPRPLYKQPGPDPLELAAAEAAAREPGMPARCGGALCPPAPGSSTDTISLRVLLDGSCLEVFTSTGQALATRVYRGDDVPAQPLHVRAPQKSAGVTVPGGDGTTAAAMAAAAAAGAVGWEQLFSDSTGSTSTPDTRALTGGHLQLVSFGRGPSLLLTGSAWQMSSMWQEQLQAATVPAPASVQAAAGLPLPAATAVTAAASEVLHGLVVAEAAAVAMAASVAPVMLPVGELSLDVSAAATGQADSLPLSPAAGGSIVQVEAA